MSNIQQTFEQLNSHSFLEFVYEFYKTMKEREITLVYEGEITHQITKAFTSLTETNMNKEEEAFPVQKKVYHVMIECLQNISRHADSIKLNDATLSGRGIFMVSRTESEYSITTGNAIDNTKIHALQAMLENINSLSKDELNDMYAKQITEGQLSDKGGAGLGFIDIVRKTGRKLDFHFLEINDTTSFFILTSFISRVK